MRCELPEITADIGEFDHGGSRCPLGDNLRRALHLLRKRRKRNPAKDGGGHEEENEERRGHACTKAAAPGPPDFAKRQPLTARGPTDEPQYGEDADVECQ